GGGAIELAAQSFDRSLDLASPAAHRPRHPVLRPEIVENRAANALHRVGLELPASAGAELLAGVDQAEDRRPEEVTRVDVRGQSGADLACHVLDQRSVVQQKAVAKATRRVLDELSPQRVDGFVGLAVGLRFGHGRSSNLRRYVTLCPVPSGIGLHGRASRCGAGALTWPWDAFGHVLPSAGQR